MDEPLAPALGALAVAEILGDGGEQARIDHARPGGVVDLLIWYPLLEDECYQLCLGVP